MTSKVEVLRDCEDLEALHQKLDLLRAQNAALLEALRAARPDLVAYSNSYGGDYLESLRLVDAAIALGEGETA